MFSMRVFTCHSFALKKAVGYTNKYQRCVRRAYFQEEIHNYACIWNSSYKHSQKVIKFSLLFFVIILILIVEGSQISVDAFVMVRVCGIIL